MHLPPLSVLPPARCPSTSRRRTWTNAGLCLVGSAYVARETVPLACFISQTAFKRVSENALYRKPPGRGGWAPLRPARRGAPSPTSEPQRSAATRGAGGEGPLGAPDTA